MFLAITIILLGLCLYSLYTALVSWRAVLSGRVHIDVIRDLTGLVDREEINSRFGHPEPGLIYRVSVQSIRQARGLTSWLLSNEVLDATMIGLLVYSFFAKTGLCQLGILSVSALYMLMGYGVAVYLILSHIDQIEEEI